MSTKPSGPWTGDAQDPFADVVVPRQPEPARWKPLDLRELGEREAPPRMWMVENLIPLRKSALLTGEGAVGKSLLAQMMCTCIALGVPFLGVATRQARSAYLTWEDDGPEIWRRQEAINRALGIKMADLGRDLELVSFTDEEQPFILQRAQIGLDVTPFGQSITDFLEDRAISFACFDNASQIANIDHNAIEDVAPFAHWLNRLAQRIIGATLLLHHPNKSGADWLGSVAYTNQFRSRLLMTAPSDNDPDARELTNPKANYSARGARLAFRWHDWAFVLDRDLPEDQRDKIALTAAASAANGAFLDCLRLRPDEVGPAKGASYAPAIFEEMPEAKGFKRDALAAAMNRLRTIGQVIVVEVPRPGRGKGETKKVLREAPDQSPIMSPIMSRELFPNIPDQPPINPAHSLPPKGGTGAAPEAAPAFDDDPAVDAFMAGRPA